LVDFNADIQYVVREKDAVNISYMSRSRAIAILGCLASAIEVDGSSFGKPDDRVLLLPAGEHVLTLHK
jgi:hypothetical protein